MENRVSMNKNTWMPYIHTTINMKHQTKVKILIIDIYRPHFNHQNLRYLKIEFNKDTIISIKILNIKFNYIDIRI